ncbi:MAG: hypothetical protein CMI02_07120 [Oceanospirillaceae bacterium]|nr:hypothetical protein [Oceanospirillaceae bacterium]MBT11788.1 hypothetical protein [Oceanospirillaceae bacterium]
MKKIIILVIIVMFAWWQFSSPSVDDLQNHGGRLTIGDYRILPLQDNFAITARVLSRKNYSFGREAELSPMDFALGWGPMADPEIIAYFDIHQSGRWYRWRAETLPLPLRTVETHSANMHMVPADQWVADQLDDVEEGQMITLQGKLIRADAADGWHWVSSLTRNDTGNGACELVLVEAVTVVGE